SVTRILFLHLLFSVLCSLLSVFCPLSSVLCPLTRGGGLLGHLRLGLREQFVQEFLGIVRLLLHLDRGLAAEPRQQHFAHRDEHETPERHRERDTRLKRLAGQNRVAAGFVRSALYPGGGEFSQQQPDAGQDDRGQRPVEQNPLQQRVHVAPSEVGRVRAGSTCNISRELPAH